MKIWQIRFEAALGAPDAPPVLTRDLLARMARSARDGVPLAPSSLSHWLAGARERARLNPVVQGLYLNHFRARPGTLADAAAALRLDAIVSLNSVLGDEGILNNPSHILTAVVPIDVGAPAPKLGRQVTATGTLHFFGVPRRILEAGEPPDRLASADHPRATPEKALVDWLYLAASPRSLRTAPPWSDLDLSRLDRSRLLRLAKAAGIALPPPATLARPPLAVGPAAPGRA
jgi:hypothetical protein